MRGRGLAASKCDNISSPIKLAGPLLNFPCLFSFTVYKVTGRSTAGSEHIIVLYCNQGRTGPVVSAVSCWEPWCSPFPGHSGRQGRWRLQLGRSAVNNSRTYKDREVNCKNLVLDWQLNQQKLRNHYKPKMQSAVLPEKGKPLPSPPAPTSASMTKMSSSQRSSALGWDVKHWAWEELKQITAEIPPSFPLVPSCELQPHLQVPSSLPLRWPQFSTPSFQKEGEYTRYIVYVTISIHLIGWDSVKP